MLRRPKRLSGMAPRVLTCVVLLWSGPLLAQEAEVPPNPLLRFDLGAGLRFEDDGPEIRNTVGVVYETRTRTQTLSLGLGSTVDVTEDGIDTDDALPTLTLDYLRDTGSLLLRLGVDYRLEDVDSTIPGPDFTFDSTDLVDDDGTRETIALSFDAELWRTDPVGLELGATLDTRRFNGTSDPDLDDTENRSVRIALRLEPSESLAFRPFVERTESIDDGVTGFETVTTRTGLQLSWQATATTFVDLSVARNNERETRDLTVVGVVNGQPALVPTGGQETLETSGLTVEGALTHLLRNGTIGLEVGRELETEGSILTIQGTRSLDLANGAVLTGAIGASNIENSGTYLVGRLLYDQPLAQGGRLSFNLSRVADRDTDNQSVVRTRATVTHDRPLTPTSSLSANLGLARIDVVDGFEADQSIVSYGLSYDQALTKNWTFDAGYQVSSSRTEGLSSTTDSLFSLNLSRSFTFRP